MLNGLVGSQTFYLGPITTTFRTHSHTQGVGNKLNGKEMGYIFVCVYYLSQKAQKNPTKVSFFCFIYIFMLLELCRQNHIVREAKCIKFMYEIVYLLYLLRYVIRISVCKRAKENQSKASNLRLINANHLTLVKNYSISVPG